MRIVTVYKLTMVAALLAWMPAHASAPDWSYHVVAEFPHDTAAFTEGLALLDGRLLESTGLEGRSFLSIRDVASGKVMKRYALDSNDFGEGATVAGNRIVQLTWHSGVGYFYDLDLKRLGSFTINTEGWGLTWDGHSLIRSDGSPTLRFISTENYSEIRTITAHDGDQRIWQLNELEWANGRIYANVWHTDRIAVIEPADGHVIAWLDLGALNRRLLKQHNWNSLDYVLNGIAFDPNTGHFLVTGKCWPTLFEIEVDSKPEH